MAVDLALKAIAEPRRRAILRLVRDEELTRFEGAARDALLKEILPGELRAAGLIARADGRGDLVVQIAPPLICDAAQLDEVVDRLGEAVGKAGEAAAARGLLDRAPA